MVMRAPLTPAHVEWVLTHGQAGTITEAQMRAQFSLGRLPPALQQVLACQDLELVISVSVLEKILFDHGISAEKVSRLAALICDPEKIFKSVTHPGSSVVVVTIESHRGTPIVVPIWLHKQMPGRQPEQVHWVSSGYSKDHAEIIEEWENEGLLIWQR